MNCITDVGCYPHDTIYCQVAVDIFKIAPLLQFLFIFVYRSLLTSPIGLAVSMLSSSCFLRQCLVMN